MGEWLAEKPYSRKAVKPLKRETEVQAKALDVRAEPVTDSDPRQRDKPEFDLRRGSEGEAHFIGVLDFEGLALVAANDGVDVLATYEIAAEVGPVSTNGERQWVAGVKAEPDLSEITCHSVGRGEGRQVIHFRAEAEVPLLHRPGGDGSYTNRPHPITEVVVEVTAVADLGKRLEDPALAGRNQELDARGGGK